MCYKEGNVMADKVKGLLFDTRSIQRYIYAGDKLKANIGASCLVQTVFDEVLVPVLNEMFGEENVDADSWRSKLDKEKLAKDSQCVVASNDGGNALILFSHDVSDEKLRAVTTVFSKKILTDMRVFT